MENQYSKLSDEDIVKLVRSDDKNLYSEIVNRYKDRLLRYVNSLVGDTDKSSFIVQDAFIKGFINLNSFNINKKFSSWIYRIAHNETVNAIKKNNKEIIMLDDFDIENDVDINREFEEKELAKMVQDCIGSLPVMYSEPLSLFYLGQRTYEEISDIMMIPSGTVAIRISRAKNLMKKLCLKN